MYQFPKKHKKQPPLLTSQRNEPRGVGSSKKPYWILDKPYSINRKELKDIIEKLKPYRTLIESEKQTRSKLIT